jgi:L-histidine N-alpha-methyltransferase
MSAQPAAGTTAPSRKAPGLIAHMGPADLEAQLRRDAREGLTAPRKTIPSKWFYDYTGSMLFDEITRLPEYYLTRSERQILRERAAAIVSETGADTLVELGCGLSEKTRILLDAFGRRGDLKRFLPFDVDGEVLQMAAGELLERYPALEVQGIVGDFERHLDAIDVPGRCLVIFLGSTIGNLDRPQRKALLSCLAASLKPGDFFLLGVDLMKDVGVIEAAYNDSAGISAAFNKNILAVLNSRLGGDFDIDRFVHVARFNPETEQMEMYLKADGAQQVRFELLDLDICFEPGEMLHTEISAKFRRDGVEAELEEAGLSPRRWWTDAEPNFALSLSEKVSAGR